MHSKKLKHIAPFAAKLLLVVFALAITPWAIFHHHEAPVATETNCGHTVHFKSSVPDCLVCQVHFEKNYTAAALVFKVFEHAVFLDRAFILEGIPLITPVFCKQRGPPAFF